VNEALFLSDKEKKALGKIVKTIEEEIDQNIDQYTQKLVISNLELLLDYCMRYYDRQFFTRTNLNQDTASEFESFLKQYFKDNKQLITGIPSVKYCATEIGMSPNYLSDLLKKETGKSALDHIQSFIIEKAKTILLNSNETVSQVAYGLGFEYPQHFSKIFKKKVGISPAEYRNVG
jgi:AraC-like DNA-binding protein